MFNAGEVTRGVEADRPGLVAAALADRRLRAGHLDGVDGPGEAAAAILELV